MRRSPTQPGPAAPPTRATGGLAAAAAFLGLVAVLALASLAVQAGGAEIFGASPASSSLIAAVITLFSFQLFPVLAPPARAARGAAHTRTARRRA